MPSVKEKQTKWKERQRAQDKFYKPFRNFHYQNRVNINLTLSPLQWLTWLAVRCVGWWRPGRPLPRGPRYHRTPRTRTESPPPRHSSSHTTASQWILICNKCGSPATHPLNHLHSVTPVQSTQLSEKETHCLPQTMSISLMANQTHRCKNKVSCCKPIFRVFPKECYHTKGTHGFIHYACSIFVS